jgi:amino acid transporter
MAVITMSGGNPQGEAFGFSAWKAGAMSEYISTGSLGQFLGFWSVFIQAAFAYGGPDFLAMTAGEAKYPRRVLPLVFRRVIYRLLAFYIGGVLCVGILVRHDDPLLGTAQKGAGSSPFVLAAVRMGIPVLPSVINALILTSAWSCGICLSYTASRNIYSNALNGVAPAFFKRTWRGVPYFCVLAVVVVGLLSFMTLSNGAAEAFAWITNLLGGLWILNMALQHIIYIRFRAGLSAQGIDRKTLPFYRRGQLYYSWASLFGYSIIFLVSSHVREVEPID